VTQVIIAKKDQIKASKGMLESGLAYGFYLFLLPLEIMDERKQQDASQFLSMWLGLLSHAYESHPLCCMKASVFLREQEDPNPEYRARLLSLFDVLQTLKVPFPFTPTQLALIERARQETAKREAIRLEIKEAIKPDPSPPATGSLVVFSHRSVTQPDPAASKDAHAPKNQDASGNHGL
jgi:hypothetical protein